jgi:hypothetical protein
MQVKILRSYVGQAVASGEIEITKSNIESFAAEISRYLNRGYEIDLTFGGKEVNLNKPMPAAYIVQILS